MNILLLIAVGFVVIFIYSWQRSRPRPHRRGNKRSGLSGQDSSSGFGDGGFDSGGGGDGGGGGGD